MISIIIPVFNKEPYIKKCIESIFKQSYKDFEIILVNDGSTDDSLSVCQSLAQKNLNITVIDKPNGGVSSARNRGLDAAKGEWITFVDADDELPEKALESLILHVNEDVDLIYGDVEKIRNNVKVEHPAWDGVSRFTPQACLIKFFKPENRWYQGYIGGKLYRHSVIKEKQLRFRENIHYNEDRLFTVEFVCSCRGEIIRIPDIVYIYYVNETSAMWNIQSSPKPKFETDLDAYLLMYGLVNQYKDKNLSSALLDGIYKSWLINSGNVKKFSEDKRSDLKRIRGKVLSVYPKGRFLVREIRRLIGAIKRRVIH